MIVADLVAALSRLNPERVVFVKTGENEGGILASELASLQIVQGAEGREALVLFPTERPAQSTPEEITQVIESPPEDQPAE